MTREGTIMASGEPVHFRFGDSRALCDELTVLVLAGRKTATCMPLRNVENGAEAMPEVGRRDVATDWDGVPVALIETTEVTVRRFDEVDEDFALAEGEDESLEGWQTGHRRYFERNGGWSPDMPLVCERFRLVEDLRQGGR
jgi:uncharacterized protein YhfF